MNKDSRTLRDRWDGYITELTLHENRHGDIAREAVEELTRAVSEMRPARSCSELDREVQTLCRRHMEKLDKDQQAFDEATGHGFPKGPQFP